MVGVREEGQQEVKLIMMFQVPCLKARQGLLLSLLHNLKPEMSVPVQISQKKLSTLAKKHHGATPLQVIHHRILLEAKRLLTFGEQSHKEIALDLGFDNPAAFSAFIKKRTGRTASELQLEVAEIHRS